MFLVSFFLFAMAMFAIALYIGDPLVDPLIEIATDEAN